MKSNKGKGLIGLIIALALVGLFGYFGYTTMNDIKLGLDLAGGVSITYQAKEENPTAEDMSDTIYKLQQRVQNYSTEAEVYQEGSNRINVDIPGVSDANAILEELGKPGSLIFVDEAGQTILNGNQVATAKPVITDENGIKKYMVDLTFTDDGKTVFADATTKNVGKRIAIIYDGKIYSNPVVNEPITQGQCQIEAWPGSHFHQFKGGRNRIRHRSRVHDYRIFSAGSCGRDRTFLIRRPDSDPAFRVQCDPDTSGCGRYHPFHWYGG